MVKWGISNAGTTGIWNCLFWNFYEKKAPFPTKKEKWGICCRSAGNTPAGHCEVFRRSTLKT